MKKLSAILAAALLAAVSCSKEAPEAQTVTVHFSVDGAFSAFITDGPALKSVADGSSVTEMYVGVFDSGGNAIQGLSKKVDKSASTGFNFDLQLVESLSYRVVLFAQSTGRFVSGENWAEGLRNISLTGFGFCSEADDAFTVTADVTPASQRSVEVSLARPWAQLNVATDQDWAANWASPTATITVSGVPTSFDAYDGSVSGSASLSVSGTADGSAFSGYSLIGYAYVPVAGAGAGAGIEIQKGGTAVKTVENVPLQRNYRTNILGNI